MSPGTGLHPDFGSFAGYGIPYNVVSGAQSKLKVTFTGAHDESDSGPYPIPPNPISKATIWWPEASTCLRPPESRYCQFFVYSAIQC